MRKEKGKVKVRILVGIYMFLNIVIVCVHMW